MGVESTSILRARAGISHALLDAVGDGHCGLPRKDLIPLAVKLLEIPEAIIEEALALESIEGTVIEDALEGEPAVFLATLHHRERPSHQLRSDAGMGSPTGERFLLHCLG